MQWGHHREKTAKRLHLGDFEVAPGLLPMTPARDKAMTDTRFAELHLWVRQNLNQPEAELVPLAGDASFRRYFRASAQGRTWMVMDAPPPQEDCQPFVALQSWLAAQQVRVPALLAADLARGFVLLEDLGNTLLSQVIQADNASALYSQAMNQLIHLQKAALPPALPEYDAARLMAELRLFDQWFLPALLQLTLRPEEQALLEQTYQLLVDSALEQPQVLVHRDFHARNLMVLDQEAALGIIDFQDAVAGPVTYDLVSLLRDAYVAWPDELVRGWVHLYWQRAQIAGLMPAVAERTVQRWFDWMGAQRHLKVLGIFVRLSVRDGKHGYLGDLHRVLAYLLAECRPYPELGAFVAWLEQRVQPVFAERLAQRLDALAQGQQP